jgi:hypothetical protein
LVCYAPPLRHFSAIFLAQEALWRGFGPLLDVKLELGAVSESATVAGDTPLLPTDTSHVSSTLTAETVKNVPIVGRNIINL